MSEIQEIESVLRAIAPVLAFVLGAAWGSFLNVCIYRLPAGKSIVFPGSHCTSCGMPVRWYDNIPILSYFLLLGHCRFCGTHFSARYAGIELLTAILFTLLGWYCEWKVVVLCHWVIVCLLIVATFTDIDHFVIPDSISVGGLCFSLIVAAVLGPQSLVGEDLFFWKTLDVAQWAYPRESQPLLWRIHATGWSLLGAGFGWALLTSIAVFGRFLFKKEAMGGGDVKLFSFLGAYVGIAGTLAILFLSAVVGAVVGTALLVAHKLLGKDEYDEIVVSRQNVRYPPYVMGSAHENGSDFPATETSPDECRSLRVARRTSRQLHHFPYGPYIAFAALIVIMFFNDLMTSLKDFVGIW